MSEYKPYKIPHCQTRQKERTQMQIGNSNDRMVDAGTGECREHQDQRALWHHGHQDVWGDFGLGLILLPLLLFVLL